MDNFDDLMTCDNCCRVWDGNAQCPCRLIITSSSDDELFPSDNENENQYFTNPLLDDNKINKDIYFQKWKSYIVMKCNEKRHDILDNKFYTKKEMNRFYGDNYIWNQQSPKMLYIKRDLFNLIQSCENVSDDKIKLLIDILFQKIY